jgi:hypothetical protein
MRKPLLITLFLSIIFSLNAEYGFAQRNRGQVIWQDKVNEAQFKSIRIYPEGNMPQAALEAAVIGLNDNRNLILEFDEIADDFDYYFVRFVHCNADWSPSGLFDMDILTDYNEFPILDYSFSRNTQIRYVSYRMALPRPKMSGNYAVVVYRNRRKDDVVFSRRIMIADNLVNIGSKVDFSSGVSERDTHQQLGFTIHYPRLDLNNPMQEIKVVLRQNYRWDNAISNLKPFRVQESQKMLDYRGFDLKNNFPGGNEFRFFDLRTLSFQGQNVVKIEKTKDYPMVWLGKDRPRTNLAYAENLDVNGNFIIENRDLPIGQKDPEYVLVNFLLESEKLNGDVFINGALSNWGADADSKMRYIPAEGVYKTDLWLKQGWYDYAYHVSTASGVSNILEGDFFQTENVYEVIVYYRPIGGRGDLIIGYQKLDVNRRRN